MLIEVPENWDEMTEQERRAWITALRDELTRLA